MGDVSPEVWQLVLCKMYLDQQCLAEGTKMEESGSVELLVISHLNCLGKKKLQPRKCVFLVMASRAPSNQAHVPFCGVYPYNPINRSCSSSKKTKQKNI